MKYLEYYFVLEFQWNQKWFSSQGIAKTVINFTHDVYSVYGFVDYSIVSSIFSLSNRFQNHEKFTELLNDLKNHIQTQRPYTISEELVGLEFEGDTCRPIDYLSLYGPNGTSNWNLSTKVELQFIPAQEIIEIMEKWKIFLEVLEKRRFSIENY